MRTRSVLARSIPAALGLMALGWAAPAVAQAPEEARTIRVSGAGEVEVTPDEAQLSFAVETRAATARAAAQENARIMERVIAALVAAGVPRGEIETAGFSIHPEYAHDLPEREPRIRGYVATNRVVLATGDLDRVGQLIDVALDAGANRFEGISFRVTEGRAAFAQALREAVAEARASAEAIAAALGVRLGPVLDVVSMGEPPVRPVPAGMMRAEMAVAEARVPTPIEPGEQVVRAQVVVIYAIE